MREFMVAGTGTNEYDGVVYQKGELFYFKITAVDSDQEIYVSEVTFETEEEALNALENKIDNLYL